MHSERTHSRTKPDSSFTEFNIFISSKIYKINAKSVVELLFKLCIQFVYLEPDVLLVRLHLINSTSNGSGIDNINCLSFSVSQPKRNNNVHAIKIKLEIYCPAIEFNVFGVTEWKTRGDIKIKCLLPPPPSYPSMPLVQRPGVDTQPRAHRFTDSPIHRSTHSPSRMQCRCTYSVCRIMFFFLWYLFYGLFRVKWYHRKK